MGIQQRYCLLDMSGRWSLVLQWSGDMEPFIHVRKMELVVAMVGGHGAFETCQEEGACCCYVQKEWSLLDMVRKMELFDATVRKKELVVAIVGGHGAFETCQEDGAF